MGFSISQIQAPIKVELETQDPDPLQYTRTPLYGKILVGKDKRSLQLGDPNPKMPIEIATDPYRTAFWQRACSVFSDPSHTQKVGYVDLLETTLRLYQERHLLARVSSRITGVIRLKGGYLLARTGLEVSDPNAEEVRGESLMSFVIMRREII